MKERGILFFTSFNERSIQIESIVLYFKNKGYPVFFLTTCSRGEIHDALGSKGVETSCMPFGGGSGPGYYLKCARFLIKMCKDKKIRFVHSHLQVPNFISAMAQKFINSTVFHVRHNSDVIALSGNAKEKAMERMICSISKHIIAISDKVKMQLIEHERVNPRKIHRINNGYRFSDYELLSKGKDMPDRIRNDLNTPFMILSPGRLIPTKRHQISIRAVKELIRQGLPSKLIILGTGPDQRTLEDLIRMEGLAEVVTLAGYHSNISDYMKAADVVIMPSESEASSNSAKEAGYFHKPLVVCSEVGDFSDYIVDGVNGFLLPKSDPSQKLVENLKILYHDPKRRKEMGDRLFESVLQKFDIENVGKQYEDLQESIIKTRGF